MLYRVKEMVLLHNLLGEISSREPRSIEFGDVLLVPLSTGPLVNVRTQFGQDPDHTILAGYNRYK